MKGIRILAASLLASAFLMQAWALPSKSPARGSTDTSTIETLRRQTAQNPADDHALYELSRAYSQNGERGLALDAIKKAISLKPDNVVYLRAGATLAAWNGQDAYALELYRRILKLAPDDGKALLGKARVENWLGKVDCSARDYRAYISKHPDDRNAQIEYAQVETWRGGYAQAMKVLEAYRKKFGADDDYRRQKAVVLALAKRSGDALAITDPMLKKNPDDYTSTYARTVALANGRQPVQALQSLNDLEKLKPSDRLTTNTRLFVTTPLRSTLGATFGYNRDSDNLSIWNYSLAAKVAVSPVTFMTAGLRWVDLSAKPGSGLERLDGNPDAWQRAGWLGFTHRFSPKAALDLTVGGAQIQNGTSLMTYNVRADFNPTDALALSFSRGYGFYLISPRALSYDVRETTNQVDLHASMGLMYKLDAQAAFNTFSDGNRLWDLSVAPRREILRTGAFNFDLGLRAWWFGFQHDYGHGYYSPNQYQRYAIMGYGYWKIDDNDGIGFVLAPGYFKDNTMGRFKFGFDASLQGTFGIYRDWMLQVSISHVDNNRVASGAYRGTWAQVALVRRF